MLSYLSRPKPLPHPLLTVHIKVQVHFTSHFGTFGPWFNTSPYLSRHPDDMRATSRRRFQQSVFWRASTILDKMIDLKSCS